MTTQIEAMKMMVEALEGCINDPKMRHTDTVHYATQDALAAGRAAIEAAERVEPVAWRCVSPPCKCNESNFKYCSYAHFTNPPSAEIEELEHQLAECERERDELIGNFIWQFSQYVGGDGEFTLHELRAFYDKCSAALAKLGAGKTGE